jgi:hypothetical protein
MTDGEPKPVGHAVCLKTSVADGNPCDPAGTALREDSCTGKGSPLPQVWQTVPLGRRRFATRRPRSCLDRASRLSQLRYPHNREAHRRRSAAENRCSARLLSQVVALVAFPARGVGASVAAASAVAPALAVMTAMSATICGALRCSLRARKPMVAAIAGSTL